MRTNKLNPPLAPPRSFFIGFRSQMATMPATESIVAIARKRRIHKTFQADDRVPPHQAPVGVVVLVVEGQMDLTLGR